MDACTVKGCPGQYEERKVTHTVRRQGEVIVIDGVPAEVCSICGDVLFRPATIRRLEELLKTKRTPARTAPLFDYAEGR